MRCFIILLGWALSLHCAAESVTLPWQEFKTLYHDNLEQSIKRGLPEPEADFLYTLDEVGHALTVQETETGLSAIITLSIHGAALNTSYETIPLLAQDVAIASIQNLAGGHLLNQSIGYGFLPNAAQFTLKLSLLTPILEDKESLFITYQVPAGLSNKLSVELPHTYRLEHMPGMLGADGQHYFAPDEPLKIRFRHHDTPLTQVDIDTLGELAFQDERAILTVHFVPAQAIKRDFNIQLPAGARYLSSSLKTSAIRQAGQELTVIGGVGQAFSVQYALQAKEGGTYAISMPTVLDNTGRTGYLSIIEPDGARLRLDSALQTIEPSQLPASLNDLAETATYTRRLANKDLAMVSLQHYTSVSTPEVVMDSLHFFVAFEENGSALGTLKLTLPSSAGSRLQIRGIPEAQIWSLTVNGQKKNVYSSDNGHWIIPLATGKTSEVELAWLVESKPLTLQGRLDAVLPELGLPARHLHVGVALPERVELVSIEADVNPANGKKWPNPATFIGKPYYFSRAFHTGQQLPVAIFYKEPIQKLAAGQ
ncbi:MAG: hypothetical protein AAF512_17975 [Pseudomonadota bacterium]